jgi:hypothetical protein
VLNICIYDKYAKSYDPAERRKKLLKHAVDLSECEPIFDAPMLTRGDTREE